MRLVMLRVQYDAGIAGLLLDEIVHPQFLLQPQGHSFPEGRDPRRSEGQIGLQQPLELDPGLVVKGDVVQPG